MLNSKKLILRVILTMCLVGCALLGILFKNDKFFSPHQILYFLEHNTIVAPFVFVVFYSVAPLFFFPTLPLNLLAGFFWGPYLGTLYAFIGSSTGSAFSFLIARFLARDFCQKKLNYDKWLWLLSKVEQQGWKTLAFVKLNPILPSTVMNYLLGITQISFRKFFLIGSFFIFPPTFAVSLLGNLMHDSLLSGQVIVWKISILLAILSTLLLLHRALKKKTAPEIYSKTP